MKLHTMDDVIDGAVYTPKQIADVLGVPSRRIVQAFRAGEIAGIELGPKTIRITGRSIREWLNRKNSPMSLVDSGEKVESSPMDNGASTSNKKGKSVGDLALASV